MKFFLKKRGRNLKSSYLPESFSAKLFQHFGIEDKHGNTFALYKDDYLRLCHHLAEKSQRLATIDKARFLEALIEIKAKLIVYLSAKQLPYFQLDIERFNKEQLIVNRAGTLAQPAEHQNCLVLYKGKFYMHPKVRSQPEAAPSHASLGLMGMIGLSHSSFGKSDDISFAGSFLHDGKGWILENTSGHYGTPAFNLVLALEELQKQGLELANLRVKTWYPRTPSTDSSDNADYIIRLEPATVFLHRTQQSLRQIDSQLAAIKS